MAAGVDSDFHGNPWVISYNGSTATHTLPYIVIGAQKTGGMAYPWLPKRIRWVSVTAAAADQVIVKDYPGIPAGTTDQRTVFQFVASGADQDGVDEARPYDKEQYVGMEITQFDSGILYIYF